MTAYEVTSTTGIREKFSGEEASVNESGYLFIRKAQHVVVAIYAPGAWASMVVEND